MNLPHIAPLLFAKKIIRVDDAEACIMCEFDEIATLAMFIEAAAQSSFAFDTSNKNHKIGFLTVAKDIKLLNTIKTMTYIIKLKKIIELNNMKQFSFDALEYKSDTIVVSGTFTILIKN